jgi:hypothetical protein
MNSYYTLLFFASILLFNHSSLAYRIHPNPYEQYQETVPMFKMILIVPSKGDIPWAEYISPPSNQGFDGKYSCNLFLIMREY